MLGSGVYPFLSITQPVASNILVIEGWIPERAYAQVAEICRNTEPSRVLIVVPVYDGDRLYDEPGLFYDDYIRSVAVSFGVPADRATVILALATRRDRTYHAARVSRRWLAEAGFDASSFNLATMGPHARRSRLLYQRAFGSQVHVGVFALAEQTYDPDHWWRYSSGIRDIISESLGYLYARLLFRPRHEPGDDIPYLIPEKSTMPD